jgi:hypothetical protein
MGMFGRDYAWILIGKPEMSWWLSPELLSRSHQQQQETRSTHPEDPASTFEDSALPQSSNSTAPDPPNNFYYSQHHQQYTNYNPSSCSAKQLSLALENTILVDRHNFIVRNMNSISGMVSPSILLQWELLICRLSMWKIKYEF